MTYYKTKKTPSPILAQPSADQGGIQGNESDQSSIQTTPPTPFVMAQPRRSTQNPNPGEITSAQQSPPILGESLFAWDHSENPNLLAELSYQSNNYEQHYNKVAIGFILLTVLSESCAISTVTYSMEPLVRKEPYGWSSRQLNNVLTIMYFFQYFTAFVTTVLSDTYVERFVTIIIGYVIYSLGYVMYIISQEMDHDACATTSSKDFELLLAESGYEKACTPLVIWSLYIIGIGSGIFIGNVIIFGADQVRSEGNVPLFFHLFYMFCKLGDAISCYLIDYLELHWNPNHTYQYSNLTAFGCLCLSFVLFMLGRNFYSYRSRQPDLAPTVFRILRTAISRENRRRYNNYLAGRSQFGERLSKYDFVKFDYGGQFRRDMVEAVERFVKLIPVFLSLFPYYYFKISFVSLFRAQGVQMAFPDWDVESRDPDSNDVTLKLPVSWYSTGINLAIVIVVIPLVMFINSTTFHNFLVKVKVFFYRARGRKGTIILEVDVPFAFSASKDHRRLILGLCLALISMILAMFLDIIRHSLFEDCIHNQTPQHVSNSSCTFNQTFNGVTYQSYGISILWQLPQQYFAAVSEVFVVVTAYQIAYLQAPDYEEEPYKMQGIFIGLHFLSRAVGAAFVLALSNTLSISSHLCIFQPNEDDKGTLDENDDCSLGGESFYQYYIIIAVIQALGILSSWYSFRRFFRWSNGGQI